MYTTLNKEELIKRYATNEDQVEYIEYLGDEVFENVRLNIEYMEKDGEVTFYDIQEQALVTCILHYDIETMDILRRHFPHVSYTQLEQKSANSKWSITEDNEGYTNVEITMSPENHMTMTLLGTLEDLEEYILEQGVAGSVVFINNENGEEFKNTYDRF